MAGAPKTQLKGVKDLYEIGEIPPAFHVPEKMWAWAIRRERHGPPATAMQLEVVPTHAIGEDEVLVLVMAAGVNYNGVWAALGEPISPFDGHKQPFHIAGSDASGIVWAVGSKSAALEAGRRGRHPLQSGRWRRRRMQWRRSDVFAVPAHLGL